MPSTRPIVLLAFVSVLTAAQAQEEDLSNLKAPQSPAATIIGIQPSTINRPKSWDALEGALFSNFVSGGSLAVPNDFALEFSPFWASNKKRISNERFLAPRFGESLVQNFSVSIASTQAFQLNDSLRSNALGFGMRTMVINGIRSQREQVLRLYGKALGTANVSNNLYRLAENLTPNQDGQAPLDAAFVQATLVQWKADNSITTAIAGAVGKGRVDEFFNDLSDELLAWVKKYPGKQVLELSDVLDTLTTLEPQVEGLTKLRDDPRGFRLEVAGSLLLNFPTDQTEYSFVPKAGIWITPSYQHPDWGGFEVLGVVRYLWYRSEYFRRFDPSFSSFDSNFDAGLRLVFKREKFSLEGELVSRWSKVTLSESFNEATGETTTVSKTDDDLQYLVNVNYQLREDLTLSYSFGKQLQPQLNLNVGGDLVSLLTLNVGFGAPKLTDTGITR